jgi:sterol desaturase/sphingolipid hydroxylase (fatty acid hydroxylase superfamily)
MIEMAKLRPLIAITVIILCVCFEYLKPVFKNKYKDRLRFNGIFYILNIIFMKVAFPVGIYLFATNLHSESSVLLNFSLLPKWLEIIATIVIFDLAIYWQHRIFHLDKFLWKFHITHHSDTAMDFSNAFRFHPGEIIISGFYKVLFLYIMMPSIEVFMAYEIILHTMAVFNHSNISIPKKVDHLLRLLIVTPSMHYPHHSPDKRLTNTNYGNFLSLWDRLFGTYTSEENEVFGIDSITENEAMSFKKLISLPFKS